MQWAWEKEPDPREKQREAERQIARSRRRVEMDIAIKEKKRLEANRRASRLLNQGKIKEARTYSDRAAKLASDISRMNREAGNLEDLGMDIRELTSASAQQQAMEAYVEVAGPASRAMVGTGQGSVMAFERTRDRLQVAKETMNDALNTGDDEDVETGDEHWKELLAEAEQRKAEKMILSVPSGALRSRPLPIVDQEAKNREDGEDMDDDELMQRLDRLKGGK